MRKYIAAFLSINLAFVVSERMPQAYSVEASTGASTGTKSNILFEERFEGGLDAWEFSDKASWETRIEAGNGVLFNNKPVSDYKPPHRSPHNIALISDLKANDYDLEFKVKSLKDSGAHRDCCVFFGYQGPDQFYYVHLGARPDPASGQIMLVDKADRRPLTKNETPVPWTDQWHKVKLERRGSLGKTAIYFDDMTKPIMEVEDKTFGSGRIGLGSFDDMNAYDDIVVTEVKTKAASPTAEKKPPARPEPTVSDYVYGTDSKRQVFDFWKAESDQPTPVVVMIHGGGWRNGDKRNYGNNVIKPFLKEGISVAAINYRFIDQAMEQGVKPPVKAPLHDAARAIQTIRSKAQEWNIDPSRIAATGSSAGACTSLWLALHDDLADPTSDDPIARESTRLLTVAVTGAQTSLDPIQLREWISNAEYGGHAFGFAAKGRKRPDEFALLLENRESLLPWIKEYSPMELVTKDDPAIFLEYPKQEEMPVLGGIEKDPTHSAMYGIQFQKHCEAQGVPCHLVFPANKEAEFKNAREYLIQALSN